MSRTTSYFLLLSFTLLLLFSSWYVSAQSARDIDDQANNIRLYLMDQATEISEKSLEGIKTLEDWVGVRSVRQHQLAEMLGLGSYPVFENRIPANVTYVDTIRQEGFSIVKLYYESMEGLYVPANLYIPDDLPGPAPAILYVCGHAHYQKSHYQSHARSFASNGFVVLLIETIQRGEVKGVHLGPYERGWFHWYSLGYNPAGVEVWNGLRGIDLLTSRTEVNPQKIGVTGISGGGSQSWYLGALDDRITATAAVAGAGSLQGQICTRTIDDHCDCMMPINTYQWDFTDIGALIAPRPFLIAQSQNDGYYSIESVQDLYRGISSIYELYDHPENISMIEAPGGHSYGAHDEMRPRILAFFLKNLMGIDKSDEEIGPVDHTPVLSEEALLVYDHQPPEGDRTKNIQETFIPLPEPPQITSESDLEKYRNRVTRLLKTKTFGAFPENPVPLNIRKEFSTWDFSAHGREDYSFIPETGWRLKVQIRRTAFPDSVNAPLLLVVNHPESDQQELSKTITGVRKDMNIAYFNARGIGETAWGPHLNWHIRRSAAWTGRTLASMRVYDVLRCLEVLRKTAGVDPDDIHILAGNEMAVIAAYAALLDGHVKGLILKDPPPTQNRPDDPDDPGGGMEMLNCLQITDFPQIVGLQYPGRVILLSKVPESFAWVNDLYSELGKTDNFRVVKSMNTLIFR